MRGSRLRPELGRAAWTLLALLMMPLARAEPHVPLTDDTIVGHLPGNDQLRQLAPLREIVRRDPGNSAAAVELARGYVAAGRRIDDPRPLGYALAILEPCVARDDCPPDALFVAADAAQYLHQFDRALALLNRSLARRPDARAQLMKAGLLELRGDYDAARRACAGLARQTAQEIAIICLSSVASRTGSLKRSFETLTDLQTHSPPFPLEVELWLRDILAEMAGRLGDTAAQGEHLRAARALAPQDLKIKAAYADWLLARGLGTQVLTLLADDEAHDGLLLRLAIASAMTGEGSTEARRIAALFRDRQAFAVGDGRHLREQARFLLEVEHRPAEATHVALQNWNVQREADDVRVLVEAARRSGDRAALATATSWIAAHGYEDRRLQ